VLVDDIMFSYIIAFWERFEPYILDVRKRRSYPTFLEYGGYLYGVVHGIWKQEHPGAPETLIGSRFTSTGSVDAKLNV
jgi:hypothetical protein